LSKVIKVEDQVYNDLDKLRAKGETFSQVIEMLLSARVKVLELWSVLEGQLKYNEWREQKLQDLQRKVEEG